MKNFTLKNLIAGVALSAFMLSGSAVAQSALPTDAQPMIVIPHNQTVNYKERTLCMKVVANVPFEVTGGQSWLSVRQGTDGTVYIHVDENADPEQRMAVLMFANAENGIQQTMAITQKPNTAADLIENAVMPSSCTDNGHANVYSDGDINNTLDGNTSTLFHSPYSGGISSSNPAILTYNFTNPDRIDYINFVPRTDGGNGAPGNVELYIKRKGESAYTLHGAYDWEMSTATRTVTFEGGLTDVSSIQLKILTGKNGYASLAEVEFRKDISDVSLYSNIFADDVLSSLKPGVTLDVIDTISVDAIRALAKQLYMGNYNKNYRVASYPCHLSPFVQSELWNSPGKYYDQMAGVTGINISKGKNLVMVSGIPDDLTAQLKVVAWYAKELDEEGKGGGPATYTYSLENGLNLINFKSDFDGLAYISYYSDDAPTNHPDIKVHFVNGQIQGYLSPDKTNEEMLLLCQNAPNTCMDLVGDKVHSVWTSKGLANYCKASDGSSLGFIQYINLLDSLVGWEHDLLGLTKYGRTPDNRTMAYVNYTYYMFQGGYGVSFMYNQESRVLNCRTMIYNDDDAIWGLSHEWGHQHQMTPYFCWAGLAEASNNMNSCYNVLHMGYTGNHGARIQNNWTAMYKHFFQNGALSNDTASARIKAYTKISDYAWCPEIQDTIRAQYNRYVNGDGAYLIPSYATDRDHGVSINEVYVEELTAPFFMLYCYFSDKDNANYVKDFQEDLYESLRQSDNDNGSAIEPDYEAGVKKAKTTVDKYELLCSAQNGNKNGAYQKFIDAYPSSVWTTHNFITPTSVWTQNSVPAMFNYVRKASKLSGYNLYPFFERCGFMRTIVMTIGDYGDKGVALLNSMRDEFKADMDALGLKTLTDEQIEAITSAEIPNFPVPNFPNTPTVKH